VRDLARWRVGAVAGAALIVGAAVAGAELMNAVEAGTCVVADEVDEFTDEHSYTIRRSIELRPAWPRDGVGRPACTGGPRPIRRRSSQSAATTATTATAAASAAHPG
jgi:hypothetical protein